MDLLARLETLRGARKPLAFTSILAALALALLLTASEPPEAAGDEPGSDPTTTVEEHFSSIGSEQVIYFDNGIRSVDVVAIGGFGASLAGRIGGRGAKVAARVAVGPDHRFYVLVGGDGGSSLGAQEGGFNGGGWGSKPDWTAARGAGGGGATDLRTLPSSHLDSLDSRVLVAGGGGGAGGPSDHGDWLGGTGGHAGESGARGANATPQNTVGSGGFGGAPGTQSAGGAGGQGGFVYPNGSSGDGSGGGAGQLGQGGTGGDGAYYTGTGMGAGGGGGYYGGGGGGGGMYDTFNAQEYLSGGGGGGGGSSLVPEGGTMAIASGDENPMVEISYTVPGTTILSGPAASINVDQAEFSFESSEPGSTFECRLDEAEEFTACESPTELADLAEGAHTFRVRAVNEMGNTDETPAEWSFTVDRTAPKARIDSGPSAKTEDRRPEFTFSSSEAGSSFRCRFDQEAFRACSGASSDRPAADLSVGAHAFAVQAIDGAGNAGPTATRSFEVEADRPNPPPAARLQLKRPKLRKTKGIAVLPARVSGAGEVVLLRSKAVKASKRNPGKAGTVKLVVKARGKKLTKLRRSGRVKVKVRVRFTPKAGRAVAKTKRLTLRKVRRKR